MIAFCALVDRLSLMLPLVRASASRCLLLSLARSISFGGAQRDANNLTSDSRVECALTSSAGQREKRTV